MVITVCYASKNLAAAILAARELTGTRLFPFLKNQCGDVEDGVPIYKWQMARVIDV
ncbi:hypothetical protein T12_7267 [Trichinella patagoniensis]|uniref:Uncharacterized protein n=1 Tax=Trichinella patagoniensis TaxID=990121 RepID=A0A0V0ZCK4_9BILA|nr:hypothetical protein T12_7267 [Trichinella patagoniensis]